MSPTCSGLAVAGHLLEVHGGRVEQLVDDRARSRPRARFSCSGVSGPRRWRAFSISARRISSARCRSSTRSGTTSSERRHSRNSRISSLQDRLGRRGLLPPLAQVGLGHRLEVVEVVEEDARDLARVLARCRAAPRCRSGTAAGRGASACAASTSSRWITMPGAPVPLITMSACASSARSASKGAARPPRAAASCSAFSNVRPPRTVARAPVPHHLPRRELAHLARADEQHRAVAQLAEDLPRELDRDVRDRDRVAADRGLGARALGGGDRPVAQRVQHRAQAARLLRGLVGLLHLPEDLRLAEHHRVEARRHAEGVAHRRLALEPVEVRLRAPRARRSWKRARNAATASEQRSARARP